MRIESDELGIVRDIQDTQAAVLASNPNLGDVARAKILGKPVYRGPHVTTYIEIDLRTGERAVTRVLDEDAFERKVQKAAHALVKQMRAPVDPTGVQVSVWRADMTRQPDAMKVSQILAAICEASGFSIWDLCGPRRDRRLARARQIAYHLLRVLRPDLSLPAIGRALGDRDHTTIIHGLRVFEQSQFQEPMKGWLAYPAVAALLAKVPA